jgi:hypothetical protein
MDQAEQLSFFWRMHIVGSSRSCLFCGPILGHLFSDARDAAA